MLSGRLREAYKTIEKFKPTTLKLKWSQSAARGGRLRVVPTIVISQGKIW